VSEIDCFKYFGCVLQKDGRWVKWIRKKEKDKKEKKGKKEKHLMFCVIRGFQCG